MRLAAHFQKLVKKDAEDAVKMILDAMTQALQQGHRIEIRGFGSFQRNRRPARMGRNPKTGEKVHVPGKFAPRFKAGKELRVRVDTPAVGPDARRSAERVGVTRQRTSAMVMEHD